MGEWLISNAKIVTPDGVINGGLVIKGKKIHSIASSIKIGKTRGNHIDAKQAFLLPGFIDLHNDLIENCIKPRAEVEFPFNVALFDAEMRSICYGITTLYHSVRFSADLGIGSLDKTSELGLVIKNLESKILRRKIHVRVDINDEENVLSAINFIGKGFTDLLSIMDHSPGRGQFKTLKEYVNLLVKLGFEKREAVRRAKAKNISQLQKDNWKNALIREADKRNVAIASHDDDEINKVGANISKGVKVFEFPLTQKVAEYVRKNGGYILVGAPNLVRGASSAGNIGARTLIQEGLVDAIVSDYHPPSMLYAVPTLLNLGFTMEKIVRLLSTNPAHIMGLKNLGSIRVGNLADLIIVRVNGNLCQINNVFVNGHLKYTLN